MGTYIKDINVAQINDALVTYNGDQTITAGLTALKTAIINGIVNAADCPQCANVGKINVTDQGADICPLCKGLTKTSGQYKAVVTIERFELAQ